MANLVLHPRTAQPAPDTPHKPLEKHVPLHVVLAAAGAPEQAWDSDGSGLDAAYLVDLTVDLDAYLAFNAVGGDPDATDSFLLRGGESYNPGGLVVVFSLRFVNANVGEKPTLRGVLWGN